MKRQLNLNVLGKNDALDLSLNKLIGSSDAISQENALPKLQTEDAISLAELSATLDCLCEELLQEEDILLACSTNDFINKYTTETLSSIDQLLAQYASSSYTPTPTKDATKIDFKDLLKDF